MSVPTRPARDGVDRDSWGTPRYVVEFAARNTPGSVPLLDPCPSERSKETLAGLVEPIGRRLEDESEETVEFALEGVVLNRRPDRVGLWINPPLSRLQPWTTGAAQAVSSWCPVVWLCVPQRTETFWWRSLLRHAVPEEPTARLGRLPVSLAAGLPLVEHDDGPRVWTSYGWAVDERSVRIYEPPRRIRYLHPETGEEGDSPRDQTVLVRICWLPEGAL